MLRKTLMGIVFLALLAPIASAQTVDEIIAKNIEARGGMKKLKSVQSVRMTGKMVLPQGMELPFVMMNKRPKNSRMEFTFQGMTGTQAYDGKNAWAVMPMMGKKDPEPMSPEDSKQIDQQADFDGPLVDYKEKGNTVELIGKDQVEGADAYKLKVTLKGGDVHTIYIDAETFLEVKVEAKRTVRGTEVEGQSLLGNYKDEGGLMMAHSIENGAKGSPQTQKMIIDKVEVNPELSDSLFAMPKVAADSTKAAAADSTKGAKTAAAAKPDSKTVKSGAKKSESATKK